MFAGSCCPPFLLLSKNLYSFACFQVLYIQETARVSLFDTAQEVLQGAATELRYQARYQAQADFNQGYWQRCGQIDLLGVCSGVSDPYAYCTTASAITTRPFALGPHGIEQLCSLLRRYLARLDHVQDTVTFICECGHCAHPLSKRVASSTLISLAYRRLRIVRRSTRLSPSGGPPSAVTISSRRLRAVL